MKPLNPKMLGKNPENLLISIYGVGGPLAFPRGSSKDMWASSYVDSTARLRIIEREKGEDGLQYRMMHRHDAGVLPSRPNRNWA